MTKPWHIAAYFVAVIVLVVGAVAGLIALFGGDESASTTAASSSSATSTAPPLLDASPTPSDEAPMEGDDQQPCVRDREQLRSRSQLLAVAWETLAPDDTTASREARLTPYVVSEFFRTSQNSVSVETDLSTLSLAERARITQRITQKAKASNEEVEVVCSTTADSEAATTVNVSVWTEDADGTQLAPPLPESLSINWRLVKSVWRATLVTPN